MGTNPSDYLLAIARQQQQQQDQKNQQNQQNLQNPQLLPTATQNARQPDAHTTAAIVSAAIPGMPVEQSTSNRQGSSQMRAVAAVQAATRINETNFGNAEVQSLNLSADQLQ